MLELRNHKSITVKTVEERERLGSFFEPSKIPLKKIRKSHKNSEVFKNTIQVRLNDSKDSKS